MPDTEQQDTTYLSEAVKAAVQWWRANTNHGVCALPVGVRMQRIIKAAEPFFATHYEQKGAEGERGKLDEAVKAAAAELRKRAESFQRKRAECKADEAKDRASGKLKDDASYEATWNYYEGMARAFELSAQHVEAAFQYIDAAAVREMPCDCDPDGHVAPACQENGCREALAELSEKETDQSDTITLKVSVEGAKSYVSGSAGWGAMGEQEITEGLAAALLAAGHEPPYRPTAPETDQPGEESSRG